MVDDSDTRNRELHWRIRTIHSVSTDSEIIRASIDDPGVFSQIFDRHARAVGTFAARRVGDAADDVLSETFLVAFRRRVAFDTGSSSALPWLLGIASRLVRRQRAAEAKQWRSFQESAQRETHVMASDIEAADVRIDAERRVKLLSARVAALSLADRETLLLHAWADLTYEEIAVALRVPVGTVRSRLNRVRRRLDPARTGIERTKDEEEVVNGGRFSASQ